MKKHTPFVACFLLAVLFSCLASAQTFNKGSLLLSVSEGSTYANYVTANNGIANDVVQGGHHGTRDPFFLEYGLSKHWGIGIDLGTDIYNINSSHYYGLQTATNSVKPFMSEMAVEGNYHFFTTKKADFSAFTSAGLSSVTFKGNNADAPYSYAASGSIIRIGGKARYYVFKRLGIVGMLSAFSSSCSTKGTDGNTLANNYVTSIQGVALEFGLCYRILR